MGVGRTIEDWQQYGLDVPLLVNLQPAGEYLGEDYYRAGGVPALVAQLIGADLIDKSALTVSGRTLGENCPGGWRRGRHRDPAIRAAAADARGVPRAQGESLRRRDHEDQRDLG